MPARESESSWLPFTSSGGHGNEPEHSFDRAIDWRNLRSRKIMDHYDRPAFVALAELASREDWCWKLSCTTCGNMYFRYGLHELALGKHPDAPDWVLGHDNHARLERLLGQIPWMQAPPAEAEQRAIAQCLADAPVTGIRAVGRFPDWLGYLGLGLYWTEDTERQDRHLTRALTPQLLQLIRPETAAHGKLRAILVGENTTLRWTDLELVEAELRGH